MDVLAAYREVGRYRGAAQLCGNTHKTVRRIVERHNAGGAAPPRRERGHNYDRVAELVADRVQRSQGRISAKRLLPAARTAGYEGSPRNSREKAEVPVVDGHGVNPDQGLARSRRRPLERQPSPTQHSDHLLLANGWAVPRRRRR